MIKRESYMGRIRPFIDTDVVKILTGLRRSGKSVMLTLIQEELRDRGVPEGSIISLNFEDLRLSHLLTATALHDEILRRSEKMETKVYLFFDEIQEVEEWQRAVNSLRIVLDCDIYLTGSNAKLLSGELATYLAGRYVEFVIYPFSFGEFLESYRGIEPDAPLPLCFQRYIALGGMPYLSNVRYREEPVKQYLTDLFSTVQLKDIVARYNVRDVDLLFRIIAYVMANVGTTFSATSLAKYFKSEGRSVATETILNYIQFCCDAYLLYRVKREDLKGKEILSTNEKYYIADHGIRASLFGDEHESINLVLENIVYMELLRRGYLVTVGRIAEREVDFVAKRRGKMLYVQVAYLLASQSTIEREFTPLEQIRDNYPKYVVSMDEFDMGRGGIKHRNIRDFLLLDEWE